jgi:hypothetical protein
VSDRGTAGRLRALREQIDFDSEQYYNLYFESAPDAANLDLASEAWAGLNNLNADLTKVRGELYRLSRGVEQLRMPALEAIGLDKVVEQLRGLDTRLRPLGEVLNRTEEDSRLKRIIGDLLGVVDSLDRVFELLERQPGSVSEGVARGFKSVYQLLMQALSRAGLVPIEVGERFDPHVHLAMGTEAREGLADGAVSRVLQTGYMWNGQIFRPVQVTVVKNG